MYDELIKDLRENHDKYFARDMQAADAIEELSKKRDAACWGCKCNKIERNEWIPVTERLPEILHTVIISGRMKYKWETDFFRFVDVATYTEGEFFETFNDWYEGQDEFEITHWMPLPEPPKEERKDPCADCRYYPPSSLDGKPCCACDPSDPLMNCHDAKDGES